MLHLHFYLCRGWGFGILTSLYLKCVTPVTTLLDKKERVLLTQ